MHAGRTGPERTVAARALWREEKKPAFKEGEQSADVVGVEGGGGGKYIKKKKKRGPILISVFLTKKLTSEGCWITEISILKPCTTILPSANLKCLQWVLVRHGQLASCKQRLEAALTSQKKVATASQGAVKEAAKMLQ